MTTKLEKLKALRALGINPDEVLKQSEETEKELDQCGVTFKEKQAAVAELPPHLQSIGEMLILSGAK